MRLVVCTRMNEVRATDQRRCALGRRTGLASFAFFSPGDHPPTLSHNLCSSGVVSQSDDQAEQQLLLEVSCECWQYRSRRVSVLSLMREFSFEKFCFSLFWISCQLKRWQNHSLLKNVTFILWLLTPLYQFSEITWSVNNSWIHISPRIYQHLSTCYLLPGYFYIVLINLV